MVAFSSSLSSNSESTQTGSQHGLRAKAAANRRAPTRQWGSVVQLLQASVVLWFGGVRLLLDAFDLGHQFVTASGDSAWASTCSRSASWSALVTSHSYASASSCSLPPNQRLIV